MTRRIFSTAKVVKIETSEEHS